GPSLDPGLTAIIRVFSGAAERGSVASIAQHRLVPFDHAITSHGAGIAKTVAGIDNIRDGWARKVGGSGPNTESPGELLIAEHDEVGGHDHDQTRCHGPECLPVRPPPACEHAAGSQPQAQE